MVPSLKRNSSAIAEISFNPSIKSCLVKLPPFLIDILTNKNTIAQNVVVEISFRQPTLPVSDQYRASFTTQSIYTGWSGFESKRKAAVVVGRDGIAGSHGGHQSREQDIAVVEIDSAFARLLGIADGSKVGINLHIDPPLAHVINIEPLTSADWEMIELHAQFLELNFLAQVRALPNPACISPSEQVVATHPITLHLSPTSTANVTVTHVMPQPSNRAAFVKIAPDAEIIVAPKERASERPSNQNTRHAPSRKSVGDRSSASTVRRRSNREHSYGGSLFLRAVARGSHLDWSNEDVRNMKDDGLKIWVNQQLLDRKPLRGSQWVTVSILKPRGIISEVNTQTGITESEKPATKLIARLGTWDDGPDLQHVALSSMLCSSLSAEGMVGGIVRIEPASNPLDPSSIKGKESHGKISLKITPFLATGTASQSTSIKFGAQSKQEKEESCKIIYHMFGRLPGNGLLHGPLTDGLLLPANISKDWHGGIVRFNPPVPRSDDESLVWLLPSECQLPLIFQPSVAPPSSALKHWSSEELLDHMQAPLIGVDPLVSQLVSTLLYSSSVLLTGGLGSGKTKIAQFAAQQLQHSHFFHIVYFSCRSRMAGEYKVSSIKENLERLFAAGEWGARLGGRSVIILDDLDTLCFAESELGEGGDNVRSRHISEGLCALTRKFCSSTTGVVLLVTAQGKESLNNIIIGGHAVQEILNLSAPGKEIRKKILEAIVTDSNVSSETDGKQGLHDKSLASYHCASSPSGSSPSSSSSCQGLTGFKIDPLVDLLDISGQTDGYMPGDLVLLASRTRSECLIRHSNERTHRLSARHLVLTGEDFSAALKGFTPASLRNVTLQKSVVKWSSIGGLQETRQILLETLQYPTAYAPIFSKCPLRLRSGILLYGYPGCGKTLLASAIAAECGLNFISVKGPEILNKYIGASEKSVRDLFERAQAARPCVLFFDEFDSIAPKRGHDSTGVTDRVVNQLLTQMDGAEGLEGVYVLAATSRPDLIDPALIRPGRLDKSIMCDMPGFADRVSILTAVAQSLKLDDAVPQRWPEISSHTAGFSGADLQALVYNAQLEAVHDVLGNDQLYTVGKASTDEVKRDSNLVATEQIPSFDVFRLGDFDDTSGSPTSQSLVERAIVAAKLQQISAQRSKQFAHTRSPPRLQIQHPLSSPDILFHTQSLSNRTNQAIHADDRGPPSSSSQAIIKWPHVQKSLATTRASIPADERSRLARIYREFVVGRTGDLPNGQGGTEVGGRTSLM